VATIDQSPNDRTNSYKVTTLVQRLQQLGFSHTLRVTLAYLDMTFNYFIASKSLWIVDSGATDNMTGNKSILLGLATTLQSSVQIANDSTCNIDGIGSTQISQNISLLSVLYVLYFPKNLMSVRNII
jgi:hypothetical protein